MRALTARAWFTGHALHFAALQVRIGDTSPPESEQGERTKKKRSMREKYYCGRKYENIEMRAAYTELADCKKIKDSVLEHKCFDDKKYGTREVY